MRRRGNWAIKNFDLTCVKAKTISGELRYYYERGEGWLIKEKKKIASALFVIKRITKEFCFYVAKGDRNFGFAQGVCPC